MIMLELIESIRQHYDELEDKLKSLELELKAKDKRIKELEAQISNNINSSNHECLIFSC